MSNIVKVMKPLNPKIFEGLLKKYKDDFDGKTNMAEERYGYFVLCYGNADKRQMKVYEDYKIVQTHIDLSEMLDFIENELDNEKEMRSEFERLFGEEVAEDDSEVERSHGEEVAEGESEVS